MKPAYQVKEHLRRLAFNLYDYIIRESGNSQHIPSLFHKVMEYESYNSLIISIARDPSLAKFFPALRDAGEEDYNVDFIKRLQTIIIWSDGSSEGMTPLTLCCGIITGAFQTLWSRSDSPTLDDTLEQLPETLALARNLAEKRSVKIPVVVAIRNIELVRNQSIAIGPTVLRKPLRYDRSRLFAMIPGQEMNAVLRLETEFSAIHMRSMPRENDRDEEHKKTLALIESLGYNSMEIHGRRVQDAIDRARLAIILASPKGEFFAPVQGLLSTGNPLSGSPSAQTSNARSTQAPYPAQKINALAVRKISQFAPLIEKHPDVLRTGIRRLLLATTERLYPEDGLVDAIICWESLFSSTPETSLRVCGSMAKLLGPSDPGGRHELYTKLRDLYNARNKLVHGSFVHGSPDSISLMFESRDAAIEYALDALRAVFQREDLLFGTSSSDRSLRVLLGH